MTDQSLEVHVTPLVQVVLTTGDQTAAFSDIAPNDDAATISDRDLVARCQEYFDIPAGALNGFIVERRETGNILVSPKPTFG